MLSDLLAFFGALLDHWVLLMGGLVPILVGLYEKYRGTDVSARVLFGISALFVAWAGFLAWRDQHAQVLELTKRLAVERPRLIVDEDVGLSGSLPEGSNIYSVTMELTIRNTGPMQAQNVRVRMGGSPITRLHEFTPGLDTRLANAVRETNGHFIQLFTMNEPLRPEQLTHPDVTALGGAFVLVLTYEDRGTKYREEEYFVCCQQRMVRHASAEQRMVLEPLVRAAFP